MVIVWVASLISHGHPGGEGDAAHYLIIAHSLAFDGDLDVGNDYGPGTRLVFEGGLEPGGHVRLSGAKLRPVHDVGLPLIAAPVFRVTYRLAEQVSATLPPEFMRRSRMTPSIVLRHLIGIEMSLVAAALGVFLFRFLCALKPGHELAAACGATLIVLSPPLMPFSFAFFTELPTALLAFAGFVILWKYERPSGVVACGLGALLAFLVLMHIRNIGLASALLFLAAYRWRRQRTPVVSLIAGVGSIAALRTTINYTLWGTWMSTPLYLFAGYRTGSQLRDWLRHWRDSGLLFDREHGLLPVRAALPSRTSRMVCPLSATPIAGDPASLRRCHVPAADPDARDQPVWMEGRMVAGGPLSGTDCPVSFSDGVVCAGANSTSCNGVDGRGVSSGAEHAVLV